MGPTPLCDLDNLTSDDLAQQPPARACSIFCRDETEMTDLGEE